MTTSQPSTIVPTKYWHRLEDGRIQCDVCPRYCTLQEGQRGFSFVFSAGISGHRRIPLTMSSTACSGLSPRAISVSSSFLSTLPIAAS